jgi:hypothetical protein
VVTRYREIVKRLYFRGDAAFANPEIYEFLGAEDRGYAIRLPTNRVLRDKIGAKVVSHGRYVIFQLAEVAVSRQMFTDRISWHRSPGYGCCPHQREDAGSSIR